MRQIYSLFMQSLWGFDIRLLNEVRLFPLFSIFPNSLDSVRIINFLNFKTKKRLPGSGSRWCYKIHWAHLLPQTNNLQHTGHNALWKEPRNWVIPTHRANEKKLHQNWQRKPGHKTHPCHNWEELHPSRFSLRSEGIGCHIPCLSF